MRSFDPVLVGELECAAWVAYYHRRWGRFLHLMIHLVRAGFGLSWPRAALGAALVLRALQLWAPHPDNDPDGARRAMARFFALVARAHGEAVDPAEAGRLEVEWWRLHRDLQRTPDSDGLEPLVDAVAAVYARAYRLSEGAVRPAAADRVEAMRLCGRWVATGQHPGSPHLADVREALVHSYRILRAMVG